MSIWRMSFRAGDRGPEMWPQCFDLHIAAITYEPLAYVDLSKQQKDEPKELWDKLSGTQKGSLRRVAYEMKAGDVIYVKQGPAIVGRGIVQGSIDSEGGRAYRFDAASLFEPSGLPWAHQVPVEWESDFPPIQVQLGAEPLTVKKLSDDDVKSLESKIEQAREKNREQEALEGESYIQESLFRSRNRSLVLAKKMGPDCSCEVCGFRFEEVYGEIGRGYILAHHLELVADGPRKTTLNDLALVCANCHAMLHRERPPISVETLQKKMFSEKRKRSRLDKKAPCRDSE